MAEGPPKKRALELIRQNIAQHGYHLYVVSGGSEPRFAYTVGLSEKLGMELIFAGAVFYMYDDVVRIINIIAAELLSVRDSNLENFEIESLGSFSLRPVDQSWAKILMLGVFDFYQKVEIPARQILPDEVHKTIDVPNMGEPWSVIKEPIWRWLREPWQYSVSSKSTAVTNLAALRGGRVTEAMRWEEGEWELFAGAGPDVPKDEVRIVALATLLAADQSLVPILNLQLETGLWRDDSSAWHPWGKRS